MLPCSDFDQIASRLRSMTRDGCTIEAAQVKLIGLDEIRDAAGPRWPRMRERVRSGSLTILSQLTGPDDVIVPAGDGFLIMLAEGPAGDTQRRCQKMRDALLSFYLGEEALSGLRPEVKNRTLTPDAFTDLLASSARDDANGSTVVAREHWEDIALAPVLVTQDRKIGGVLVAPVDLCSGVRRIVYNQDFILDGRHHAPLDFLELDCAVLDAAIAHANRRKAEGYLSIVGVSVHATTMQTRRTRQAYLARLAEIDPDLRRTMFVAVAELERGTPLLSIADWCSGLRAQVSRVWLDFHYADHAIYSIGASGAWAAGFHLPVFAGAQRGKRGERLCEQIGFWAKTLRGQGMRLIVHGFQDITLLEQAGSLGVDLLTSEAHWPFSFAADEPHTSNPGVHFSLAEQS